MAEALTTEPTGGALTGVALQRAVGEAGQRRIQTSAEQFRTRLQVERDELAEFRGAMRRRKRGEAISDVLTIAGLATGGVLGAGTALGVTGGLSLGGQAGQILGAGIGGESASPELQAIPTLAGNIKDQRDLADLEAAAGQSPLSPATTAPVAEPPADPGPPPVRAQALPDVDSGLRSWLKKKRRSPVGL